MDPSQRGLLATGLTLRCPNSNCPHRVEIQYQTSCPHCHTPFPARPPFTAAIAAANGRVYNGPVYNNAPPPPPRPPRSTEGIRVQPTAPPAPQPQPTTPNRGDGRFRPAPGMAPGFNRGATGRARFPQAAGAGPAAATAGAPSPPNAWYPDGGRFARARSPGPQAAPRPPTPQRPAPRANDGPPPNAWHPEGGRFAYPRPHIPGGATRRDPTLPPEHPAHLPRIITFGADNRARTPPPVSPYRSHPPPNAWHPEDSPYAFPRPTVQVTRRRTFTSPNWTFRTRILRKGVPVPPMSRGIMPTPVFTPVPMPPYATTENVFAPTTFSMLNRGTVMPWRVVCRDCGSPWKKSRCPGCRRRSPKAVPVYRYPSAGQLGQAPSTRRRRSSSNLRAAAIADTWLPAELDANAAFFNYGRPRDAFDDVLDNRTITPRDHPAGGEALVWTKGSPTPKLVSLVTAIHTWLNWTVPLAADFIESRRLCFFEEQTENGGCFYTYKEDYHTTVFDELGAEYVMHWDENEQGLLPGLTLRGLLRYVTLWILAEPQLACIGLKQLTSLSNFPAPPPQYGLRWKIDAYMALGDSHPNAIDRVYELHEKMRAMNALVDPDDPERQLWEPMDDEED